MKATHKTQRFDYSKIEQKDNPREYWEYYGFHPKHGRIHVDTKRFKKIMNQDGTTEFLFDGMFKIELPHILFQKKFIDMITKLI